MFKFCRQRHPCQYSPTPHGCKFLTSTRFFATFIKLQAWLELCREVSKSQRHVHDKPDEISTEQVCLLVKQTMRSSLQGRSSKLTMRGVREYVRPRMSVGMLLIKELQHQLRLSRSNLGTHAIPDTRVVTMQQTAAQTL